MFVTNPSTNKNEIAECHLHAFGILKNPDKSELNQPPERKNGTQEMKIERTTNVKKTPTDVMQQDDLFTPVSVYTLGGGSTLKTSTKQAEKIERNLPTSCQQSFPLCSFEQLLTNPGIHKGAFESSQPTGLRALQTGTHGISCPNNRRQLECEPICTVQANENSLRTTGMFFTNRCNPLSSEDIHTREHACPHHMFQPSSALTGDSSCTLRRGTTQPDPLFSVGCAFNQSFDMEQSMSNSEIRADCSLQPGASLLQQEQTGSAFRPADEYLRSRAGIPNTANCFRM